MSDFVVGTEDVNPTYPPAPWNLRGWGIATVQWVDVRAARACIPPECAVVTVAPGRTLGGLLFVSYEAGSTLVYRELSVAAALVRVGRRVAFYLPHLYVDNAASLAGGRAIWGVNKDLATFDVTASGARRTIAVRRGDERLCRVQVSAVCGGVRLPALMPAFGTQADRFLFFTGRLWAHIGVADVEVEIPRNGEFAELKLNRARLGVSLGAFRLHVPRPVVVMRAKRWPED